MKTGIMEAIKANKKKIIKRSLIVGGAVIGIFVTSNLLKNGNNEDDFTEEFEEESDTVEDNSAEE